VHALPAGTVSALTALKRRGLKTGLISDCTHELPASLPSRPVAPPLDAQVFFVEIGVCKPDPGDHLAAPT
jgi:putative hydrolase of the HAD superfamily